MLISIVYDSGYGHTAKQAQAVAEGAVPWETLERSAAIVFGSPTYNGSLSARLKQVFEDSTKEAWVELKWRNKIAAGFTNSGADSGDKLSTLVSMALFAAQHGMIWAGLDLMPRCNDLNRLGSWLGAMAQSDSDAGPDIAPPESDLRTAAYLGKRVAEITRQFATSG